MKDEYGNMDASGETYVAEQFTTEFGCVYMCMCSYMCVRMWICRNTRENYNYNV